ncbi:MAG TPA: LamG-like jellyroll fold domain-containing protein [Bryobacteraceae bacterium]|jgi:uncharacterized protein (TIGR03437 family)|nr:LamG-like jellyroll fold domain-containing protein [Bryobacteraceae bacterium]
MAIKILPLLLLATFPAMAASGCLAPPSGLVGWWTGDTNENDLVGGNNPSTVTGVSLVPGEVLDGMTFTPKGYVLIPSAASLANQQFTWAAWVKPEGAGPNDDTFGSLIVANNVNQYTDSVSVTWSAMTDRFVFIFGNITTSAGYVTSKDTFAPGSFYSVAATYDGAAFRLFVDGVLEASLAQTTTVSYSSTGWYFGGSGSLFPNFPRTWNGVIDEVQAFNRALSATELLSIYNAGSAGECKSVPAFSGIISASGFGGFSSIAPGSWVEIYGSNLGSTTRSWTAADFNGVNAPTSLSGTTVMIGGIPAFIDYVSQTQVNVQVPSNITPGQQQITVSSGQETSANFPITVNATEPGFLAPSSFVVSGKQYLVALFTDEATYVLPPGTLSGVPSQRVTPGQTIILYGVGFGPVTPSIPAGQIAEQSNMLADSLQLSIGGMPAVLSYQGLAPGYVGLYQFNVVVPNVAASDFVPVTFTLGGFSGTQTLYLAVGN